MFYYKQFLKNFYFCFTLIAVVGTMQSVATPENIVILAEFEAEPKKIRKYIFSVSEEHFLFTGQCSV